MYWCKPLIAICFCMLFLAACKPEVREGGPKYFDLKKYFEAEATRLNALHPTINKSVIYNDQPQTKAVTIKTWKQELGMFIEADINKPAWRDSYKITSKGDTQSYTAIDTTLRTRRVIVVSQGNKVRSVEISNFTKNMLYQSSDHLYYYPDSIYRIEKHQSVKVLGKNNYLITGNFKVK